MFKYSFDNREMIIRSIKYIIMGLVVVIATRYIPDILIPTKELIMIGATSSITFAILDMYTPQISDAARLGAGFGIGSKFAGLSTIPMMR